MRTWAVINTGNLQNTGTVVDRVCWDGLSQWGPPPGCFVIEITNLFSQPDIGWLYDGTNFTNPNPPVVPPSNP